MTGTLTNPLVEAPNAVREPVSADSPTTGWKDRVPLWTGRILQASGIFLLITMIPFITFRQSVWRLVYYLDVISLTSAPTLFNGVLLIVLGRAAIQRKRSAMWFVVLMESPGVIFAGWVAVGSLIDSNPYGGPLHADALAFFRTTDLLAGVVSGTIITLMLVARHAFSAALLPGARRPALTVLGAGFGLAVLVGWGLTSVDPGTLSSDSDRWWWLTNSALGSSPNLVLLDSIRGRPPQWVVAVVTTIAGLGVVIALALLVRSSRAQLAMTPAEELEARRMLVADGPADSLGYFATRRDKALAFAPDRSAAIAYRVFGDVALASGDPLGDTAGWPAAIAAWRGAARRFGLSCAVIATTEQGARAYAKAGMSTMQLGDEAVIDVGDFCLDRPTMAPVRSAVRHAERAGYEVTIRRLHDIPAEELATLARLVDAWRAGGPERGFSMALCRFGDAVDPRYVIVTARDAQGGVHGLLGLVPWGRDGLSLDVMRRSPDAANGVTELMVSRLVSGGDQLGVRQVSLNFAMFREALERGARIGAGRIDRLRRGAVLVLSRFWQLDSLYRSNAKYSPRWQPRLLCHDSGLPLTRALLVGARAEGFVVPLRRRLRHVRPATPTGLAAGAHSDFVRAVHDVELGAPPAVPVRRLTDQQRSRATNLDALRTDGIEPYPVAVPRDTALADVVARHGGLAPGTRTGIRTAVVGRLVGRRRHGGITFLDLREAGTELQVVVERGAVAAEHHLTTTVDHGDLLAVQGEIVTTRRGRLSVLATGWTLAAKSLQPLPGRRTGLVDPEARLRRRHVDLATRDDARRMVLARSAAVRALREALLDRDFLEVETPILQVVHGGANARPFRTRINAYDTDLTLRIAPELALKRLCVGGLARVFEIGRNFRNEGVDGTHNPEFTSVEAYQAFTDYTGMRELTRELVLAMARAVHGSPVAVRADGTSADIGGSWPVVTVHDAVSTATGVRLTSASSAQVVRDVCRSRGVHVPAASTAGELVTQLYDALVEPATDLPTFYTDFPVETSPLARAHRSDPRLAERWDLVAFGAELGTAYSELTDPVDQRRRLTAQSLRAAHGDPEAMELDEGFLDALELGMPPTGGLGLGVDRVVMMLTGATIRQTLTFPFVRPDRGTAAGRGGAG